MARPAAAEAVVERPSARSALAVALVELFLVAGFLLTAVGSQFLWSAYALPMGAYPDEAAHYLSSLMVRDYLMAGAPASPVAYATEYYEHYPAIAIGYWPPLFYLAGGSWMTVFGHSRTSMLLLVAVICAALQYLMYRFMAPEFGKTSAVLFAGAIPFVPAVAQSISMVMTDVMLTLMCFAATVSFGRFLERPSAKRASIFGALAAAALLTKSSAAWLALLPPLALVMSGRLRLLLRREIWVSVVVLAAMYGPWFALSHHLSTRGLLQDSSTSWFSALVRYGFVLSLANGFWLLLAAAAGCILIFVRPASPVWHAIAVLPLCVGLLLSVAPVHIEVRYGLMALPAVVLLACYSVRFLLQGLRLQAYMPIAVVPLVASMLLANLPSPSQSNAGLGPAVDYVAASAGARDVVLVSSGGAGTEVLMVSEFASREPRRPARTAVRANKLLAATDWNYTRYTLWAETPEQVLKMLSRASIDFILVSSLDTTTHKVPHHSLLLQTLESAPERWRVAFRGPESRYLVYRSVTPE